MTQTTTMPTPEMLQEALEKFSENLGSTWKVYENNGQPYAARRFEYLNGAQALLSVQPYRCFRDPKKYLTAEPLDLVKEWQAQVSLPFSTGAELGTHDNYQRAEEWIASVEKTLCLPFKVLECKTPEAAESVFAGASGQALHLLATVFDIEVHGRRQVIQSLVKTCMPARRAS